MYLYVVQLYRNYVPILCTTYVIKMSVRRLYNNYDDLIPELCFCLEQKPAFIHLELRKSYFAKLCWLL